MRVRRAAELLVGAFGRGEVEAAEAYRGAVVVLMRVVFLRLAAPRRLDEVSTWSQLMALFHAVHREHGGSLFGDDGLSWLPAEVDDETVVGLLRAAGDGLDVEEIGYAYESLLSFEAHRPAPGSLLVTESALRRATGTHYTPRELAEEIVEGALAPLVHHPGPVQTSDVTRWRLRPAAELLELRVADIAMGSGAFLVAAARYLSDRLHDVSEWPPDECRRRVVERCLYGVDLNPMAVEMARLSLWLIAGDSDRSFAFLDHRLVAGDSLLGVAGTSVPDRFRADLITGAALAGVKRATLRRVEAGGADVARESAARWLATGRPPGGFERRPLHWPLTFPEVFARGGFDAVIGNPPFLGGKRISGALGKAYREYLVTVVGHGVKGNADLIAYFLLRAHALLGPAGQTGLIGTNTLAQGDTREVGLDQLVAGGVTITRAVKSRRWPSRSAALDYCVVWTSRVPHAGPARAITSSLEPASRVSGTPRRLRGSAGIAFIGNFVNGIGFVLSPRERADLIADEPRAAEVVSEYLSGQDLNNRPDLTASRWIIDFRDWPLARAAGYPRCLARIERLVKPARDALPDAKRATREKWWQYEKLAPALRRAIGGLDRVVAISLVGKAVMPAMVPTGQVFSHMLGVFATDDPAMLALLSSSPHYWWAAGRASTLGTTLRYTPSDTFETFPLPAPTVRLRELGERLDRSRRELMLGRGWGLTATYNRVADPACQDGDVAGLRRVHREIDEAACRAYGWNDLDLGHGFHGNRYTIGPEARREVLDRLLELNLARHDVEHLLP